MLESDDPASKNGTKHNGDNQYISKSCLNEEVIAFMVEQHAGSKAS
ncbi:conserved hypothetical protein [Vibrio parahaemolyticus AQ3810]|nr:conserved hypothetical protein [Vibrio parahaemolyticus AQ3810]